MDTTRSPRNIVPPVIKLFKRRIYKGCDRIEAWSTRGCGRWMEARIGKVNEKGR